MTLFLFATRFPGEPDRPLRHLHDEVVSISVLGRLLDLLLGWILKSQRLAISWLTHGQGQIAKRRNPKFSSRFGPII